jgi:hypothetical protein
MIDKVEWQHQQQQEQLEANEMLHAIDVIECVEDLLTKITNEN